MQREKSGFLKKSGIILLSALAFFGLEDRVRAYSNLNKDTLKSNYLEIRYNQDSVNYEGRDFSDISYIPEPATIALLGLGSLALLRLGNKRRVKKQPPAHSPEPATSVLSGQGGLSLLCSREKEKKELGKELRKP